MLLMGALVPLALVPLSASGQGAFLARGAGGVMIGGHGVSDDNYSVYAVEGGYSFKGTVDVGVAHSWIESPADTLGWNFSGRALEPQLTIHLLKQGIRFPLSLSAVGSYSFQNLQPESGVDAAADDVEGRHWTIGGILHTVFGIADFAGLRPWASIRYINRTLDYGFGDEETLTVESDDTRYVLGLQGVVMPTARSVLFIGPELRFMGGERTVAFAGGIVFN